MKRRREGREGVREARLGRLLGDCAGNFFGGGSWSGCRERKNVDLVVGWVGWLVMLGVDAAVAVVEGNSSRFQSFSVGFVVERNGWKSTSTQRQNH